MKCPNCDVNLSDNTEICPNCGTKISITRATTNKTKASAKKNRIKLLGGIIALIAIVIGVIFLVIKLNDNSGLKIAEDLSSKIGKSKTSAESVAKVDLKKVSESYYINKLYDFQNTDGFKDMYIYESKKQIVVDGVHVPKWLILVNLNLDENKDLESVEYIDYSNKKKNDKGPKMNNKIDLDDIKVEMKLEDVEKLVKMSPFSIKWNDKYQAVYTYQYYFINDYKDEEQVTFYIVFDDDKEVVTASKTPIEVNSDNESKDSSNNS